MSRGCPSKKGRPRKFPRSGRKTPFPWDSPLAKYLLIGVEIDRAFEDGIDLEPALVLAGMQSFYGQVDTEGLESGSPAVAVYYKASVQASNDKGNRIRRGDIVADVLRKKNPTLQLL